jgi:putative CocE/NonD family hydrolase
MTFTSRLVGRLMKLPPAETRNVGVKRNIGVPMRDGVNLLADHYVPVGLGRRPIILVRSPYGRAGFWGTLYGRPFAERGFQVLIQSCRGTFGSGGTFDPFRQEHDDGMDTIEWIKAQDWFTGDLLMMGPSYLGLVQWATAPYAGSELKAIAPQITASEFANPQHPGGSYTLEDTLGWAYMISTQEVRFAWLGMLTGQEARKLKPAFTHLPLREGDRIAIGKTVPFFQSFLEHVPGDDWWAPADHSARVAEVTAPASFVTGWYDIFLPWQLRDYETLRAAGRNPYLLIGPWSHGAPPSFGPSLREALAWFRAHLGGDRSQLREAPVRLYVMGAGEWRDFAEWPPRDIQHQRWHLQPGGGLADQLPAESEPDRYRYDPADPTPSVGGALLGADAGAKDNRALERRPDVLVYTSAPLERDLEVIGPVTAELYVRSSLEHTDFFVKLCDVAPDGKSINLTDGIRRLVPGSPATEPDGSRCVRVELWPTAARFRRGHRIRVLVASGAHPRFARNTGSGEPLATATTLRIADQTVYHDPAHPSYLILPTIWSA